jgi:hypothetical protein
MDTDDVHKLAERWTRALASWSSDADDRPAPKDWRRAALTIEDLLRWTLPADPVAVGVVDFGPGPALAVVMNTALLVGQVVEYVDDQHPVAEFKTTPLSPPCALDVNIRRDLSHGAPHRVVTWALRSHDGSVISWESSEFAWTPDADEEVVGRAVAARIGWPMPEIDRAVEERTW